MQRISSIASWGRCLLAAVFLTSPILGLCSVSGIYVAKYSNGVGMLQIIETPDHRITGSHRVVAVNKTGEIVHRSAGVSGAVDGSNISLEVQGGPAISAIVAGNGLRVVGLDDKPTVFQRGSLADFETQATTFEATSATILARKVAQEKQDEFTVDLIKATAAMNRLLASVDKTTQALAGTQKRLHNITLQMADYLAKARALTGNQNSNVEFARAGYIQKVGEGPYATASLQGDFENLRRQFADKQTSTFTHATELEQGCKQATASAACTKFLEALPIYRTRYAAMVQALDSWSADYQLEKSEQDRIAKQADTLR